MDAIVIVSMTLAVLWAVLCRVNHMKAGVTKLSAFIQHALLAFGVAAGVLLPAPLDKIAMLAGVFSYLALGSSRWKHGAPEDITRPAPLDSISFHKVHGGKK